jgi:integrase
VSCGHRRCEPAYENLLKNRRQALHRRVGEVLLNEFSTPAGAEPDPGALVFPSARGGLLSNWDRVTKALHEASGTSGWHRHDLRRTVATMLGDLGFVPHVISVVLGHAHVAEGATELSRRCSAPSTGRYSEAAILASLLVRAREKP